MKKALISMAAVTFIALMIANVYAVPVPPSCGCNGFTPGFWKHNIKVRLGLTNGEYSAFEGGPLDGVKLTDAMMDNFLNLIKTHTDPTGIPTLTFDQALDYLELPGWSADRTNIANWFNHVAGYGPY